MKIENPHLKKADYITFTSIIVSWIAILCVVQGSINIAIILIMVSFFLDMADGYVARKLKEESLLGTHIDSMGDIFTYVIFSSALYYFAVSPHWLMGVIVSGFIIVFSVLRLTRLNEVGVGVDKKGRHYYSGLTTPHMLFFVILGYYLVMLMNISYTISVADYIIAIVLILASVAMISDYRSYKTGNYILLYVGAFSVIAISLLLLFVPV